MWLFLDEKHEIFRQFTCWGKRKATSENVGLNTLLFSLYFIDVGN